MLLDSVDEPEPTDALKRARDLSEQVYVVDLAWLRSTPWRERLAATFDPDTVRPELSTIDGITIRHHPECAAAALLLVGWLASRLDWRVDPLLAGRGGVLEGKVHARRQDVKVRLEPDASLQVRGLAGLTISHRLGPHVLAGPRPRRPARALPQQRGERRELDDPRRLARRGGHPRRGHPPGAAARRDVRPGAGVRQRAVAVGVAAAH